jgi:hypothetical protein
MVLSEVLRIGIRDPVLFLLLDPGSSGKKSGSWIRDEHSGTYFLELGNNFLGLQIIKFFDAGPDPNTGYFYPEIRDRKIQIRDKHPGSVPVTLDCPSEPDLVRIRNRNTAWGYYSSCSWKKRLGGSGLRVGKNPEPGSGINISDHIFESSGTIFCAKST